MLPALWLPGSTAVFAAGGDAVVAYEVTIPDFTLIPGDAGMIFEDGPATVIAGDPVTSGFDLIAPFIITPMVGSEHTIKVVLMGPAPLVKAGPGTLVLDDAINTYAGGTFIEEGCAGDR